MQFNSFEFYIFFTTVVILFWGSCQNSTFRKMLLLVASYYFYMCWNWQFAGLILLSTAIDFISGAKISKAKSNKVRRGWLTLSLSCNLGLLGIFKYYNFFIESFNQLMLNVGLTTSLPVLNIILPVGISFYTFQTMSYTIDIYRRELEPTGSLLDFAVYVAFFPQLVAGPIVRAVEFLPQLKREPKFNEQEALNGICQILFGLFKKVCIGDMLAASLVDQAFSYPEQFSGFALLLAVYGYAMQIYCDFSGYSDVAIGAARVLGFQLPINFNRPYMAASITEFWRRWHISLSSWLRDYLYFSIGGNRKGALRTYINLALTMLLGGLWHGAAWNFIIWGGLHGFYLAVERVIYRRKNILPSGSRTVHFLKQILAFHLVCVSWVLFRAESAQDGLTILQRISVMAEGSSGLSIHFVLPLLIGYLLHFSPQGLKTDLTAIASRLPVWAQSCAVTIVIFLFMILGVEDVPFIYFQF